MAGRPRGTRRGTAAATQVNVPELHELEAAVMERVWRLEKATVRDVLDALNDGEPRPRAYTTILTIMKRLHTKGMLERERHDRTDVYTPAVTREGYAHRRARRQVEELVKEFGDAALAAFAAKIEPLGWEKLAELRRTARQAEAGS